MGQIERLIEEGRRRLSSFCESCLSVLSLLEELKSYVKTKKRLQLCRTYIFESQMN